MQICAGFGMLERLSALVNVTRSRCMLTSYSLGSIAVSSHLDLCRAREGSNSSQSSPSRYLSLDPSRFPRLGQRLLNVHCMSLPPLMLFGASRFNSGKTSPRLASIPSPPPTSSLSPLPEIHHSNPYTSPGVASCAEWKGHHWCRRNRSLISLPICLV